MARMRKTDKGRLKEGRGQGFGSSYKPWILPHEVPSDGRAHELLGWKHNRVYVTLSDGELYAFCRLQMKDSVIDIREQFPLLPLNETLGIAKNLGVSHPPKFKSKISEKTVMTSDFNILIENSSGMKELVRTVKTEEDYNNPRTQEKLFVEKVYWENRGIDWGVIIHTEETKVIGRNIYSIYQDYFWNDELRLTPQEIQWLIYAFKDMLVQYDMEVLKATSAFEKSMEWEKGMGLNFFKYLLSHKIIKTDFSIKFNYFNMKVWF